VAAPGFVIVITPSQVQFKVQVALSAGLFLIITVGEPGTHGVVVTGTQGAGVGTPRAADVAAITAGFVGALHMPKGMMFFMGILSIMVAAGMLAPLTRFSGVIVRVDGATPNEHINIAPIVTSGAMVWYSFLNYCVLIHRNKKLRGAQSPWIVY
jgi:hypothetical protein